MPDPQTQETDDFQPVDPSLIKSRAQLTETKRETIPGETEDFQPVTKEMMAPKQGKFLDRSSDESDLGGIGKNAATGVVKGASWIAGMPGDVQNLIKMGVAGLRHVFNKEDYDTALNQINDRTKGTNLPTSEEVEKYLTDKTGAYDPQSFWGRVGQQAVAGATSALVPGGLAKAGTRAALGAVSGAAGQGVGELTGSPETGAVASIVSPLAAHGAIRAGTELAVGKAAQRAATRAGKGAGPAVTGNPTSVGRALTDHADQILQNHDAQMATLQQGAEAAAANAPQGGNLDQLHQRAQELAYSSGQTARARLNGLAKSIDPDGKLNILTTQVRDHAQRLLPELDKRVQANAAAPYIKKAAQFGDVVPFQDLWGFDRELSGAISMAAKAGDENGINELRNLKGAVKDTISKAVDNQHAWEQAAVARGDLSQEETLAARLQRQSAANASGAGSYVGVVRRNGTGGPGQQRGVAGVPSEAGSGHPGEPPRPNVNPTTAADLAKFNTAYGDYASTYRQGPVGQGLKRGAWGDFRDPQGGKTIFTSGDAGAQNVQAWLQANQGPDALNNLRSIASERLRETLDADGLISQGKLDAWKKKYGKALGAIDQVSPGFSQSFDSAANATEALAQSAQVREATRRELMKGTAGRLMGLDNADDVTSTIGQLINARDSGQQIQNLKAKIGNNPDGWRGVQQAAADHISNTILPSGQLDKFIKNNPTAIGTLFGPGAKDVLEQLSENQKRMAELGHAVAPGHGLGLFALWEGISHDPIHGLGLFAANTIKDKLFKSFNKWRIEGLNNTQDIYQRALVDSAFRQDLLDSSIRMRNGEKLNKLAFLQRADIAAQIKQEQEQVQQRGGYARGGSVSHDELGMRMVREVARIRKAHNETTEPILNAHDNNVARALEIARQAAGA